ncbi:type IX secretion system outer membrane channel protein PorV [Reichenbachiella versicolor]|uniref:type IX secretion system outer membrane channel protein PorV n=1 Tax=Reichenbachiella versicolor TaxID=1821036 RepID=UPI000D6DE18F|nr:type IX secretion system outer membrane channel protein PorV [Reichenbachiella versicolor]
MKNYRIKFSILGLIAMLATLSTNAQTIGGGTTDPDYRVILTAVPFLSIAPDSRASGMGDVGAATSPDINSAHWNNGKLAFIDGSFGGSLSYSPWLKNIVPDMGLTYLSGFYKIDKVQTVGISMRYFDLGKIYLTDIEGVQLGEDNPREFAFDGTYSRKLSNNWGIGVSMRYVASNLVGPSGGQDKVASSVAVDLGTYYTKPVTLGRTNAEYAFGAHISNIGQKMSYTGNAEQEDFIPVNLRIGTSLKLELDPYNSLTLAVDLNKLLVPTPPVYAEDEDGNPVFDNNNERVIEKGEDPDRNLIAGMFGSFSDAPDGFSEEVKEFTVSSGAEYWYRNIFSARAGYFYENKEKGGRQYASLGLGIRYQTFGLDMSYLIPGDQNNPLAETIRFTLIWMVTKEEDQQN